MASGWYGIGKQKLMNKELDLDTDTIKVRAVADEDYAAPADFTTATSMTGITGYSGSTDQTLTSVTIANGVLDAADLSPAFSALAQDATKDIDGLVVYHFVTNDAASTPLVYIDLSAAVTPNGTDVNITWNASGIASL